MNSATSKHESSASSDNSRTRALEWLRLPGDVLFIVGGVLPLLYTTDVGVRHTVKRVIFEEPEEILFTQLTEPKAADRDWT